MLAVGESQAVFLSFFLIYFWFICLVGIFRAGLPVQPVQFEIGPRDPVRDSPAV